MATAVLLPSCTTYAQPATCERGSSACGGIHDARFCDSVAIAVEGADCGALGIVDGKHFCVVTPTSCVDTTYAARDWDCKVFRYQSVIILFASSFRRFLGEKGLIAVERLMGMVLITVAIQNGIRAALTTTASR